MKHYRKEDSVSYALGITLTFELLKEAGEYARKVYVHSAMDKGESFTRLESLCKQRKIPMEYGDKPFNILSQKENCFIIGEFEKMNRPVDANKCHIVLHNPSNAGNMGTIMRSAVGFGICDLVVIRPAVDAFDPKTVRASMGAIFHMNISYFDTFDEYVKKMSGRTYYPFMLKAQTRLPDIQPKRPYSLIFGNEATGLPDDFLTIGTSAIIEHTHAIDSLNLPIAASIALYEVTKNDFGEKSL